MPGRLPASFVVVLVLTLGWFGIRVPTSALDGETLSYEDLLGLIAAHDVRSIDELLPLLPADYRSEYTLMHTSPSLQPATFEYPRVIMTGPRATLVIAFNGDPQAMRHNVLEIIQFSRMTRKKRSFPCYGMQWGSAIYLYPIESGLVEYYSRPPRPCHVNEAAMFGGRWVQESSDEWKLVWTERTIQDFYLNNILIHELGHLLDERNSSYADRERYAEWFATHYGYLPTQRRRPRGDRVVRRHHAV